MLSQQIGFLGAGQMATALSRGFVSAGLVSGERIQASDVAPAALDAFCKSVPGAQRGENAAVISRAQILFLAVKPHQLPQVLADVKQHASDDLLVISIAAGVRLATMSAALGERCRLVRVMPNTPCLVGQSASGYCLGPRTTAADGQLVAQLLSAVGKAYLLDEKLLDAVTGLSGSGPAFAFVMIEALADGGVRMGLPRAIAQALAAQTLKGAAEMVLTTGDHPAVLKDRVASPGGTTIAGLQALESAGVRGALIAAVEAATKRSIELGK